MADIQSQSDRSESRPPSLSETASEAASDQPSISSTSTSPPPTPHDIDRWNRHINLQEFGAGLQDIEVYDEDPKLPVSLEIAQLVRVSKDIYHYDVDEWKIPAKNSHLALNHKTMSFVESAPNYKEHLKIVYFAGHGRLTKTKLLEWTRSANYSNSQQTAALNEAFTFGALMLTYLWVFVLCRHIFVNYRCAVNSQSRINRLKEIRKRLQLSFDEDVLECGCFRGPKFASSRSDYI
ncbi:hypothetical protein DL95DRAFT_416567 [Leptodontidium sp. 2 PMI_412]|nr:hypothetical protein DL95DRAFT_416567 [Leptodontidium sp. 2 PMI_412]